MNILASSSKPTGPARHDERGFLIIALLLLVSIMLIYVAVGLRSLNQLRQDLKRVEQKQIQRLQSPARTANSTTNAPGAAISPAP